MGLPRFFLLLLPALLTFAPCLAHAEILRVSKTGDGSDGLSWATAFASIGEAVQSATHGDIIWVASGTYNESQINMVPGITLLGGFSGNEQDNSSRDWRN